MAIHLGRPSPDASRGLPERQSENATWTTSRPSAPFLLGLAPSGVYHAAVVAAGAVRSYRTLSPLPAGARRGPAVCFLWHFP